MKSLFVAPSQDDLDTPGELLRAAQGLESSFCTGLVDRQKLEKAIGGDQWDSIHFGGHGGMSVLELSDGPMEVDDLLNMLLKQHHLEFVVISACNSARVGAEIHNALHVPVIVTQAEIGDRAAVRFSETFYRAYRLNGGKVNESVRSGRATLQRLHPADADAVMLINGDMATDLELTECMSYVKGELSGMRVQLAGIEANVKELMGSQPRQEYLDRVMRFLYVMLVLLGCLIGAQIATPWLTAALR